MKHNYDTVQNNIVALTDSIEYYECKTGELVDQKTMLIGEIKDLKESYSKELNCLYDDLNSMKRKNAQMAAQLKGFIDNPVKDTIWKYDTIKFEKSLIQPFDFSNKWRILSGNITLKDDTIGLNIKEDQVFFDYTIAIEDDCIYIKSDNPYVKYDYVTAIQEQHKKPKHWNIGFQAGFGFQYGMINKTIDVGPYLGVGVSWGFGF